MRLRTHSWDVGQDVMRLIKIKLTALLPGLRCFLDVDDLHEGYGAEFVDVSHVLVVYCAGRYFTSPNCMRELFRAILRRRRIIAVVEYEQSKNGLTMPEVTRELIVARRLASLANQQVILSISLSGV